MQVCCIKRRINLVFRIDRLSLENFSKRKQCLIYLLGYFRSSFLFPDYCANSRPDDWLTEWGGDLNTQIGQIVYDFDCANPMVSSESEYYVPKEPKL